MCNEENKYTFYSLQPEGEVIIYFKNGILYIKIRITHFILLKWDKLKLHFQFKLFLNFAFVYTNIY